MATVTSSRVRISKSELNSILGKVIPTVAGSKVVPLYQCICCKNDKAASFSGTAGTVTSCKLDGMEFAVDANRFYSVVRAMPQDIELELKNERLYIRSGSNETWLGTHPTRAFPEILPKDSALFSNATNFVAGLKAVSFSVGTNPMKPKLLGIAAQSNRLYSSDGNRISRYMLDAQTETDLTIPSAAVEHLVRLGQPSYLFTSGGMLGGLWKETKTIYTTQTLASEFPAKMVEEMLGKMKGVFVTFPSEVRSIVARVRLLVPATDSAGEPELSVKHDGEKLTISAMTNEVGGAREELPWSLETPFKFTIDPKYFEQGLEKTLNVDISDLLPGGDQRFLRFSEGPFEHFCGLMLTRDA